MPSGETVSEDRAAFRPADESPELLLRQCADLGDAPAWDRFVRCFNPVIVATVVRTIRRYTSDRVGLRDDLVQDVYVKFSVHHAKVLREFEPRHPGAIFGYLAVIAANVVHDYFKSSSGRPATPAPLPHDLAAPDRQEWRLLLREIDDLLKKSVSPRDRQIFGLYYRQGMTAKQIASIQALNLSTKGVEAVIVRLNKLIREAFHYEERQSPSAVVS